MISMSDQTESNPVARRRVIESTVDVAQSLRRLRLPKNNPAFPSLVIHGYRPALLSNERQQECESRSDVAWAIIRSDFA